MVGFALVAMQAAGMIYAYRHERAKETSTGTAEREGEIEFENPIAVDG